MRYRGGKPIPANVIEALKLAGKIGLITRNLWNAHFHHGTPRAQQIQLQRLTESEYNFLKKHPNPIAKDCFVLTELGKAFIERQGRTVVTPTPVSQIVHDELIASTLTSLEKGNVITSWKSEAEMKKSQMREFVLNRDPKDKKYPDAIFEIQVQNGLWKMALEYERTRKAAPRYKDVLWLYSRMTEIKLVIFVCGSAVIENTLAGQMKRLNLPKLYGRVAFVQEKEWRQDPMHANLRLENQSFSLKDFSQILGPD